MGDVLTKRWTSRWILQKHTNSTSYLRNEKPTWCHLLFYFTYYALNMFRTLTYPSSGICDSRRLLNMDILTSETCWAHNKWNKIESDIKFVFHSSTIAIMHGPINISTSYIGEILCYSPHVHSSSHVVMSLGLRTVYRAWQVSEHPTNMVRAWTARAVSRRLVTAQARLWSRGGGSWCEICMSVEHEQACFYWSISPLVCLCHLTDALYSFI